MCCFVFVADAVSFSQLAILWFLVTASVMCSGKGGVAWVGETRRPSVVPCPRCHLFLDRLHVGVDFDCPTKVVGRGDEAKG